MSGQISDAMQRELWEYLEQFNPILPKIDRTIHVTVRSYSQHFHCCYEKAQANLEALVQAGKLRKLRVKSGTREIDAYERVEEEQ